MNFIATTWRIGGDENPTFLTRRILDPSAFGLRILDRVESCGRGSVGISLASSSTLLPNAGKFESSFATGSKR